MKSRPILFSAPMVRALLSGAKTQTRRPMRPQPVPVGSDGDSLRWGAQDWYPHELARCCPHGHAGDRLWARETWRTTGDGGRADYLAPCALQQHVVWFDADGAAPASALAGKTRVSIHMPRWASRLELEITDVRVQRLQDISEADAKAEGARAAPETPRQAPLMATDDDSYRRGFLELWESIHGGGSWAANPWCWCLTFRRINA